MIDRTALPIVGQTGETPDPAIVEDPQTKRRFAFPKVCAEMIGSNLLSVLVGQIAQVVVRNVVINMCERLKDRCQHESQTRKGKCGISRAAHHVNDHDFTEATAPK